MAALLRPLAPAIQRLPDHPGMMAVFKRNVMSRPIDALLDLFQPLEALAADIITEANRWSNKQERLIGVPGVNQRLAKMAVDQPEDARLDLTMRAFVRRIRIVTNFMILSAYDPVALTVGTAKALLARGIWTLNQFNDFMKKMPTPQQAAQVAQQAAASAAAAARAATDAAKSTATTAATNASNTAQAAADATKRFFGLRGLGEVVTGSVVGGGAIAADVAGTGGVTATGATTGAVLTPELVQLILGLIQVGAPLAADVAKGGITGQQGPGGQPPGPGQPGYIPPPSQDSGIPLPLLLVGAGIALMALKK